MLSCPPGGVHPLVSAAGSILPARGGLRLLLGPAPPPQTGQLPTGPAGQEGGRWHQDSVCSGRGSGDNPVPGELNKYPPHIAVGPHPSPPGPAHQPAGWPPLRPLPGRVRATLPHPPLPPPQYSC